MEKVGQTPTSERNRRGEVDRRDGVEKGGREEDGGKLPKNVEKMRTGVFLKIK